jgi:hypothetical protein
LFLSSVLSVGIVRVRTKSHGVLFYSIMSLQPFVGPWPLFQFLNLYTVVRTLYTVDQPVARPVPTHRTTQMQNKRTETYMARVGFEPTSPVFERAKTVNALDLAANVIGIYFLCGLLSTLSKSKTIYSIE